MSTHSKIWIILILLAVATVCSVWLVAPWLYSIGVSLLAASVFGMLRHKPWALSTTTILTSLTLFEATFVALPDREQPPEFTLLQSITGDPANIANLYLFVALMVAPWLACLWVLGTINQRKSA